MAAPFTLDIDERIAVAPFAIVAEGIMIGIESKVQPGAGADLVERQRHFQPFCKPQGHAEESGRTHDLVGLGRAVEKIMQEIVVLFDRLLNGFPKLIGPGFQWRIERSEFAGIA